MLGILLTIFALSPIVSKNPVEQDTLGTLNLHIAVGLRPANEIMNAGPELGVKLEYLLFHPVVFRTAVEYNLSKIDSREYPVSDRSAIDISAGAFIYRGRKQLTAYIGAGVVYSSSPRMASP